MSNGTALTALSSGTFIEDDDLFYSVQEGVSLKQTASNLRTYLSVLPGLVTIGGGGVEGGLVPSKLVVEEGADTPANADTPTVVISRLSHGTNEQNDNALAIIQLADDTSTTQTGGVQCSVIGGALSGDQVAFSGVAVTNSTHNAFGFFFQAKAEAVGGGAWGLQTDVENNTGVAVPYTQSVNGNKFVGADLVFNSDVGGAGKDSGCAAQIRGSGGSGFDVGLGFQSGGVKTSVIDNDADAVTLWNDTGAHTNGFNLTGATFTGAPIMAPLMSVATTTATGTAGSILWSTAFIYVCVATNSWKRAALSTW